MTCHPSSIAAAVLGAVIVLAGLTTSWAQDRGPASWAVTGVGAEKGLNVRRQPSMASDPVGSLPRNAHGIANLGCRGGKEPGAHDTGERKPSHNRWCRIRYKDIEGWVAARFLKPDTETPAVVPDVPGAPAPQATAPTPPADPGPTAAPPQASDIPAPPAAAPKTPGPDSRTSMTFACKGLDAVAVRLDDTGTVTQERHPPREAITLMLSVTPSAPESAGPVATAMVWQMLGQQGDRFGGSITWGKSIDARDGLWRLDLQTRMLNLVIVRQGTQAHFYRFKCE
jgi:hypothetical protein